MRLLNFAIIKLLLFLVLGILFGYFARISLQISLVITICSLLLLLISQILIRRKNSSSILFGVVALITTFSAGMLMINLHDDRNWNHHYSQLDSINENASVELSIRVNELLKPSIYQDKYFGDIMSLNGTLASGKILLNVQKDSLNKPFNVDDILFTKAQLISIAKPLNPHQFDYGNYLKRKNVYHQINLNIGEFLIDKSDESSIKGIAESIRETINESLKNYDFNEEQLSIINAILLGQKQNLSKDLYQQYASAGVIHILAVSGLHVGIILLILQFLLKPLEQLKYGLKIKTLLIVVLLWCFALIAGLSPSVVRAVTMFSIVAIGLNMKRPTSVYNTLAISMFVLLLFNPMFLFEVGFQLSYLAVFAIVWIQPKLYRMWSPKYKVTDYFWQILTVTVAAQIGVAPLSIFYFHQFPGLFFLSNLVIIPVLGLILGLGILVVLLAVFNILPGILVKIYGSIIASLNTFVSWVAQQEAFLFKEISFSVIAVILSYMLLILGARALEKRNFLRIAPFLLTILIAQVTLFISKSGQSSSVTVFHKSRHSIVAFQDSGNLLVSHSLDSIEARKENVIKNYSIGEDPRTITFDSLRSVYRIKDEFMLVIDSIPAYNVSFNPNIVLLRNSPKLNLKRMAQYLKPELIIADGSNYKNYVSRWEETCKKEKLPFHATAKKGALTIELAK